MEKKQQTTSPVLFLIFNRPDVTTLVFEAIRKVKPKKLYIAADGYRIDKEGEQQLCEETRSIVTKVDWDCEVKTLFRDTNLGCKYAVSSAITWFFDNEEQGIILEDDCLPNDDFFFFCDELLDKYKDDDRIMHIGGTNFHADQKWGEDSYYFSNLLNVWGWASWRRAWSKYDVELNKYKEISSYQYFYKIFNHKIIAEGWENIFKELLKNKINTWDYQWAISMMFNNGLSIMPNVNLISNIGFGNNATHTNSNTTVSNLKTQNLSKITHPIIILPQKEADFITLHREFRVKRMKRKKFFRIFKFWKNYNN